MKLQQKYNLIIVVITTLFIHISLTGDVYSATVKGKLITPNEQPSDYKVVAVLKNGKAKFSTVSAIGKFSVKVTKGSTLHLVDNDGRYRGPLVATKGTKAFSTLQGSKGKLGRFTLRNGFASTKYRLKNEPLFLKKPKLQFDSESGPPGAGKFGFVDSSSTNSKGSNVGTLAVKGGQDTDKDGIPNILDIDDDGDLILDVVDQVEQQSVELQPDVYSTLRLDLVDSLNVNSGGISDSLIDTLMSDNLILRIGLRNNGTKSFSSVNVDCQGLSYCNPTSGTGTIRMDNGPLAENENWIDYDPDTDGLPNLQLVNEQIQASIGIRPHATREELRTGDTILFDVDFTDGSSGSATGLIPFVFVTGPALKQYVNDGTTTVISYPVTPGSNGTSGMNPFVLNDGRVTLNFWKPQRQNIEGAESEGYFDMGGLNYGVSLAVGSEVYTCNADEYSDLSETLSANSGDNLGTKVLRDSSVDSAASISNTLTYTVDLEACLTRQSVNTSNAIVTMAIEAATDQNDSTSQFVIFEMP